MLLIGYRNYIFRLSLVLVRFRSDGYLWVWALRLAAGTCFEKN
jgi:hypothetical protein